MSQTQGLAVRTLSDLDQRSPEMATLRGFLDRAAAGTLFHEPAFLAYHPEDRFAFQHLVVLDGADIAAFLPGGVVEQGGRLIYRSPRGASFGGPVLAEKARGGDVLDLLRVLQDHARQQRWAGIELVPPPRIYRSDGSDVLDFALPAAGFALAPRMLCHALPLDPEAGDALFANLFRGKNVRRARAALKAGVETVIGGIALLDRFRVVFDETYARHNVTATHSLDEIRDLFRRLPDRFRLAVATLDGTPLGGLLLMQMSKRVSNAFYICNSGDNPDANAGLAMFATTLNVLAGEGNHYLDLGPSSHDDGTISGGVAYFKESLGAVAYCRDRWAWSAEP
jgi:hypothetical protein